MNGESHEIQGAVDIIQYDPMGDIVARRRAGNLILNSGREVLAGLFAKLIEDRDIRVGVGEKGEDFRPTDTIDRRTFIDQTGIDAPEISVDETTNRVQLTFSASFGEEQAAGLLREAGILFTSTASEQPDILYNGVTFSQIDKHVGDTLTLNWEITF